MARGHYASSHYASNHYGSHHYGAASVAGGVGSGRRKRKPVTVARRRALTGGDEGYAPAWKWLDEHREKLRAIEAERLAGIDVEIRRAEELAAQFEADRLAEIKLGLERQIESRRVARLDVEAVYAMALAGGIFG